MAKVCPKDCLFAEECYYAYGDGLWPDDCALMIDDGDEDDEKDEG